MLKLDHTLYALTQDNPSGPAVQFVDDGLTPTQPSVDSAGNPTRASLTGYVIAYALVFVAVANFLLR